MTVDATERGSATIELVLLTPVLISVLLFVVALGRVASARADVDAAARDAARAATNARSADEAQRAGDAAGRASVHDNGVTCQSLSVALDTASFHAGGTVTAVVSCTSTFADLTGIGLPASRTITSVFTAPVDSFRGVS